MVAPNGQSTPSPRGSRSPHASAPVSHPRSEIPDPQSEISAPQPEFNDPPPNATSDLEGLSNHGKKLLTAFIAAKFDLEIFQRDNNLSPEVVADFLTASSVQHHLENIFKTQHLALKCRAAQSRQIVIAELEALIAETDDPIEKRKLLQHLLRATSAQLVPLPRPARQPSPQRDENTDEAPPAEEAPDLPRPSQNLTSSQTASETVHLLFNALYFPDNPDRDSAFATIAEALEHDAEIDSEVIENDDPAETIEALADSSLAPLRQFTKARGIETTAPSESRVIETWNVETNGGFTKVTFELTKSPPTDTLSRAPGRWLIRKITTSPGHPWPSGEWKPPFFTRPQTQPETEPQPQSG